MPVKCVQCGSLTTDDVTPITCSTCKSSYHPSCVEVQEGRVMNCKHCPHDGHQLVPPAPKSDRRKALSIRSGSSRSAKSSNSCRKDNEHLVGPHSNKVVQEPKTKQDENKAVSLKSGSNRSVKSTRSIKKEIELLDHQRNLEIQAHEQLQLEREKLFAEKEKFIKAKLEADLKYLKQKSLLENELEEYDDADDFEVDSVTSSQLGRERVEKWKAGDVRTTKVTHRQAHKHYVGGENYDKRFQQPQGSSTFNVVKANRKPPQPTTSQSNVITLTKEHWSARNSDMRNLPVFTGEPKEWPIFIKQFEQSTQLCGFDDVDNIVRLRTSLKGNAKKVVESALSYPENVEHIIKTLQQLFGRPEFILNDLLQDVRQLPCIKPEKFEDIIHMSIIVANMCSTMIAAAMSDHMWNPMLLQELVRKLPVQLKREWAQYRSLLPTASIETFNFWLSERSLEYSCLLTEPPSFTDTRTKKNAVNFHNPDSCGVCSGSCASVGQCGKFNELPYKEKWNLVKELQLCRMCLKKHNGRCTLAKVCGVNGCPYKHHNKLHKTNEEDPTETSVEIVNSHSGHYSDLFFKIVPVTLQNADKKVHTYALLDDGSSVTLVERWVANALDVDGIVDELCLKWTGNTHKTEPDSIRFSVKISGSGRQQLSLNNARTVSALNLPYQTVDTTSLLQKFTHLQGIPIQSYENRQPSILIGLDNVKLTTCLKLREGDTGQPVAAKTRLGWVIFGGAGAEKESNSFHICQCNGSLAYEMDQNLKNFFALENLLTESPSRALISVEDERALNIMKTTMKYLGNKYEIGLTWRFDKFSVPDTYPMAYRRLTCLEKTLAKNPDLNQNLKSQIDEYVEKGYAEKLDLKTINVKTQSWYLPIFAVRNPNKPTKVRIVWDAAAEVNNISLNTLLLKGPDQLTNLPGVLFRFRQFKIAVAGDIKQMFHQIQIRREDRPYLRFLWRDSPTCNVDTYQMNVMIFGASCSPSCAQFIKNINADRFLNEMPLAVDAIKKNHYVDDWLESVENEKDAVVLIEQVRAIHESGGFQICNFLSNSPFVLENSPNVNITTAKMFSEDGDSSEKLLGMWWEMKTDSFLYSLKYHKVDNAILAGTIMPSKRQILKLLMSIFDPLGLISHLLIFPKILMQEVWKSGISWDEVIPENLQSKWIDWMKELPNVETIRIPRWYGLTSNDRAELHVFVDASQDAFAAACYVRYCCGDEVYCGLISAKTKVAPLKLLSIPRLELSAAVLGCRLATSIINNHSITFNKVTYWTDSKTVWCWLNSDHRIYRQYIAFRVAEILETTDCTQWRWIPSHQNVADKATRQVIPSAEESQEWFAGPQFLYNLNEEEWPKNLTKKDKTNEELRSHILHQTMCHHCPVDFTRFSKWRRLTRCIAYVRRFIFNVRASKAKCSLEGGPLKREEIKIAERDCFKIAQHDEYIDEIADLQAGVTVSRKSPLYKLTPYLDSDGVLRSKSRLELMTNTSEDFIKPIILPRRHYIVTLLLKFYHETYKHQNHDTALHEIQQKFYIHSLRAALKTIRNSCQLCKNLKAAPVVPIMGNLPKARLSPFTQPFAFIGIDYFGPYFVAVGRHREKRWGVLITCLNTRAVHLDICESLTTDSCICAIKRFISRRGEPLEIFSDQGTNFKGANNELKAAISKLDQDELASEFTTANLQWHFNPPLAPHMGGVWERLVRAVKSAIEYAMSRTTRTPREELLRTMVCEAEFLVNSRPLTYLALDSEVADVLTPNHFIMGSSNGIKTFGINSDEPKFLIANWKRSNQLMEYFWKRWIQEYLPVIRRRSKWFDNARELEVGDIVVMIEDNLDKHLWRKAKVLEVSKSRDGHVRKATVQTSTDNIYERAVAKLALLDVRKDNANASTLDSDALPGGSVTSNSPSSLISS